MKNLLIGLIVGFLLALTTTVFSSSREYKLIQAEYPIMVNGVEYASDKLPILNYEGTTYVPLKAISDIWDADLAWNQNSGEVEISTGAAAEPLFANEAFRVTEVSGQKGKYIVIGTARAFEAVISYAVGDGHNYLIEGHQQLKKGAPSWSSFALTLDIPANKLPANGTLILELFVTSPKDGSRQSLLPVPLEQFK